MKIGAGLTNRILLPVVAVTAVAAWLYLAIRWGIDLRIGSAGAVLAVLTFAAECLPVEIERNGLRLAFALPFVASLAAAGGPAVATVVAVAAAGLGRVAGARERFKQVGTESIRRRMTEAPSAAWSIAMVAASACAGGAAMVAFGFGSPRDDLQAALGAVAFTGSYGLASFLLLAVTRMRATFTSFVDGAAT